MQLPFPAPLGLLGASHRPRIYHACADVLALVESSPWYRGWRRPAALAAAHLSDRVSRLLVGSTNARTVTNGEALLRHLGSPPGRAVVSSALWPQDVGSVQRQRSSDAPFRILYVGYLRPEKGIDTLLAAYAKLLPDWPDIELEIVGADNAVQRGTTAEVTAQLNRLSRSGHVRFRGSIGFGPELFAAYADADVLVLPSLSEGTPRVLVEARAFGCPVIASNVGGIPTSVTHERDGLLFPARDTQALVDALRRLLEEPELRMKLIDTGLERVSTLTVDALAEELLEEASILLESGSNRGVSVSEPRDIRP